MRVVPTTTFQISSFSVEQEYTVTVVPSNTFGLGMPASANFLSMIMCLYSYIVHHASILVCASSILCLFIMLFAPRPRLRGRLRVRLGTCTCTSRFTCYCI